MGAIAKDIAEAVKEELNDQYSPGTFTATRRYIPITKLEDLTTLAVTVVPKSAEREPVNRADTIHSVEIDIAIQQKLAAGQSAAEELAATDTLMDLVDAIEDHLENRKPTDMPTVRWVGSENHVIYSPEQLIELRAFLSIITVTYEYKRTR